MVWSKLIVMSSKHEVANENCVLRRAEYKNLDKCYGNNGGTTRDGRYYLAYSPADSKVDLSSINPFRNHDKKFFGDECPQCRDRS